MKSAIRIPVIATLLYLLGSGAAFAVPIYVDPAYEGSSVSIDVSQKCQIECWARTDLASSLNQGGKMLDIGDKWVFDFFQITVGGLGGADALINATLAFIAPDIFAASASGQGGFFTFLGLVSGGTLHWDQPAAVELTDGSFLQISFEDLNLLGFGSRTMVSATVRRVASVTEPSTLAMLGLGLLVVAALTRRRNSRKPVAGRTARPQSRKAA